MTTTVDMVNTAGAKTGSVELPAEIFDVQANIPLMHQVVTAQLNAARQGTHKTKSRGEVAGGGRKPYKQKGTGRARQGSIRAPQFTGGGVVHGPVPRDYSQRVNKKMKAAALRGALSDRAREGLVHVVEAFIEGETPRTKDALNVLQNITDARRVLVVLDSDDHVSWLGLRNLPQVHLLEATQLNTYDVLVSDVVVFTRPALDEFLGVPATVFETVVSDEDEGDDDAVSLAKDTDAEDAGAKAKAKDTKAKAAKAKDTKAKDAKDTKAKDADEPAASADDETGDETEEADK